jgi:hypothetical protein
LKLPSDNNNAPPPPPTLSPPRKILPPKKNKITKTEKRKQTHTLGGLVAKMRESGFSYVQDDVTLKLADAYGFCWGVERAVQMAYEARKQYPTENLWITNEIIHNPTVNAKLADMVGAPLYSC